MSVPTEPVEAESFAEPLIQGVFVPTTDSVVVEPATTEEVPEIASVGAVPESVGVPATVTVWPWTSAVLTSSGR